MQVTKHLFINKKADNTATIEVVGDIGYNVWADNYEDYIKNTSEAKAKELNALKELKADKINLVIESLGGDVYHAMSIYSQLQNSGAEIHTHYRGYNASAATIIGSAAKKENISMDDTGLFLVHKPMSYADGNANDMQETINGLNKIQESISKTYLNLGVEKNVIDELMERNGGHGEWLNFEEAMSYGFVSKMHKSEKVSNYVKSDFENKKLLIPTNLVNQKEKEMSKEDNQLVLNEEQKEGLFAWIKNKLKSEEAPKNEATETDEPIEEVSNEVANDLQEDYDALLAENDALKAKVAELEAKLSEDDSEMENKLDTIIENKLKTILKNSVEPTEKKKEKVENKIEDSYTSQIINKHKFKNLI